MATGRSIAPEAEARVLELYQDPTVRVDDIAREAGVSRSTVYWILEKNGKSPDRIRRPELTARRSAEGRLSEMERGLSPEEADVVRTFMFAQQEALGGLRERFKMLRAAVRAYDRANSGVEAEDIVKAVKLILTDLAIDDLPPPPPQP